MYAIILRYKVPLAEVDRHVEAHRAWLREHYAAGRFLLSGAQRPRVGGFILEAAMQRAGLDTILAGDAFHRADVADYEVIDFATTMTSPALAFLGEPGSWPRPSARSLAAQIPPRACRAQGGRKAEQNDCRPPSEWASNDRAERARTRQQHACTRQQQADAGCQANAWRPDGRDLLRAQRDVTWGMREGLGHPRA